MNSQIRKIDGVWVASLGTGEGVWQGTAASFDEVLLLLTKRQEAAAVEPARKRRSTAGLDTAEIERVLARKERFLTVEERNTLLLNYMPLIEVLARRYSFRTGQRFEVADLVNEGVLGIIQEFHKWDHAKAPLGVYVTLRVRSALSGYVKSVRHGGGWDRENRCRLYEFSSLDEPASRDKEETFRDQLVSEEQGPFEQVYDSEWKGKLAAAVANLAPQQKNVVDKFFYREMTPSEIVEDQGVCISSVCSSRKGALSNLRTLLVSQQEIFPQQYRYSPCAPGPKSIETVAFTQRARKKSVRERLEYERLKAWAPTARMQKVVLNKMKRRADAAAGIVKPAKAKEPLVWELAQAVLQERKEPLIIADLVRSVHEQGRKMGYEVMYTALTRKADVFARLSDGSYALRAWGDLNQFAPKITVAWEWARIALKEAGQALKAAEILRLVAKQGHQFTLQAICRSVKSRRDVFAENGEGRYGLVEWAQEEAAA